MSDEAEALAFRVRALTEENQELRERLERIEQRAEASREAKAKLAKGGFRLLLPLFDRQKVVRSFGKLAETVSDYSGPPSQWPAREQVLADARTFMESVVRFLIRRRMVVLFFSLLAVAIPFLQVWLVVQQNRIIENQNELFEIQVYDVVARSMTEGDRNARLMTGALLARADFDFLKGVVEESFGPELANPFRRAGVEAATRRLEDASFRGHLIHSLVRSVERRAGEEDVDALFEGGRPAFRAVLADAEARVPQILMLGRNAEGIDGALAEQVDNYLVELGGLLRVYGRLARAAGEEDAYHADLEPLLKRLAGRRAVAESLFAEPYRAVMQDFLFEVALAPELGDGPVSLREAELTPEQAIQRGLAVLREELGEDALNWELLASQVGAP